MNTDNVGNDSRSSEDGEEAERRTAHRLRGIIVSTLNR